MVISALVGLGPVVTDGTGNGHRDLATMAGTITGITSDAAVVELTTSIDVLTQISDKYDSAVDFRQHSTIQQTAINHQKGGVR